MNKLNDQEISVIEYLKSIGVKYSPTITEVNNTNETGWERDSFKILFEREGKELITEFHTGTGHRMETAEFSINPEINNYLQSLGVPPINDVTFRVVARPVFVKGKNRPIRRLAVVPNQASVLHSLLMDSISGDELFDDFCTNFDYDNDSMKAFKIYQECQKITAKLRQFFSTVEREQLSTLLEDY